MSTGVGSWELEVKRKIQQEGRSCRRGNRYCARLLGRVLGSRVCAKVGEGNLESLRVLRRQHAGRTADGGRSPCSTLVPKPSLSPCWQVRQTIDGNCQLARHYLGIVGGNPDCTTDRKKARRAQRTECGFGMSSGFSKLKTSQRGRGRALCQAKLKGCILFFLFSLFFSRLVDQALFHATD